MQLKLITTLLNLLTKEEMDINQIRAIVLDLDGTLLRKDNSISERNLNCLRQKQLEGVKIILATGRPANMTWSYYEMLELDTPLICLNGAVIYSGPTKEVMDQTSLAVENVTDIYNKLCKHSLVMVYQTAKANYQLVNKIGEVITQHWPVEPLGISRAEGEDILKVSIHFGDVKRIASIVECLKQEFQVADWQDSIELTKKSVTKWAALQKILQHYQLSASQVVAFGDGPNDVDMLKNVGLGVAMENGHQIAKRAAKFHTSNHEEDGVSIFLEGMQNKMCV